MQNEISANANKIAKKELARRLRSADPGLEVVHPNAAGIDVGNASHYVAVRPDRDPEPVRRFECFTADLYRLVEWRILILDPKQELFSRFVARAKPTNAAISGDYSAKSTAQSVPACQKKTIFVNEFKSSSIPVARDAVGSGSPTALR